MCGISGIYNFNHQPVDIEKLTSMNNIINHRGPDGKGVYVDKHVGLGNTRLAIIDTRHEADQPMFDSEKKLVIVYNGEIFNYVELRNELLSKGYKFNNNSDTEVILNLYKEYGEDCQNKLNGMWSFAIWNIETKILFCSRDRYGIKPFYYYINKDTLIFGSEIKQLLSFNIDRDVNQNMVYDYLIFHFIDHTHETFYKNIFKLPAGHRLTISNGKHEIKKWYTLPENKIDDNEEVIYKKFYDLLYDSVRLRLRSDVEVGSCLSGGLDSSTIVCMMHDLLLKESKTDIQKTYTACYDDPSIDERQFVEEVNKQTNSEKYFLFPDSKTLADDFNKMIYHQDEPFTGLTVFAQWSVFKKINETKLKVVLDGQGSDEILLGYFSFFPFFLKRLILNPFKFISEYFGGLNTSNLGFTKFAANFVYFNSPGIRYRHVIKNADKVFDNKFINSMNRRDIFEDVVASGNLRENRLANLWKISLPSLLRYEDKNSSAFSVEARLPFLDHRLVEYIFSIPFNLLIKKGWTKNVLRESTKGVIPENIRKRKGKLAFSVPQKMWINELSEGWRKQINERDFLSNQYIEKRKILGMLNSDVFPDKFLIRGIILEQWMNVFNLK
jgi:asparagine synthase (glutamine-hydrolysing)